MWVLSLKLERRCNREKSGTNEVGVTEYTKCEGDKMFKKDGYNGTSSIKKEDRKNNLKIAWNYIIVK